MIFSEGLSERKLNASNTDKRFADPKDSGEAGAVLCTLQSQQGAAA